MTADFEVLGAVSRHDGELSSRASLVVEDRNPGWVPA